MHTFSYYDYISNDGMREPAAHEQVCGSLYCEHLFSYVRRYVAMQKE